ncbi:MAG: hypothetical protein QCI82_00210 [Candidatus Thermoplasmatota archaeon]|nr:hypothetical protein [Candidatus Thermoplasmatota archaeon]
MVRGRETAQRLFAVEYNSSRFEDRAIEENAPNYVITPLGSHVNRLFFMGVLMNKTNTGTGDLPNFKAEVRDPTGTFYLYAGQYQPQPLAVLSHLEPPALVGVVGKVRTFTKEDGTFYSSVKPESIFKVDVPQRDRWVLETSRFTLERIKAYEDVLEMEEPSLELLAEKGHPTRAGECALDALRHYGRSEVKAYADAVKIALMAVVEGNGRPVEIGNAEPVKEDIGEDVKATVLSIIKELSGERGALYRDIMKECEARSIDKITLEEIIQALLDEGQVYEPTIGLIKSI